MAQQTAVEWLAEKMEKLIPPGNQIAIYIMLEQAKQMEKERHDKWNEFLNAEKTLGVSDVKTIDRIQWYYNQYFKENMKNKQTAVEWLQIKMATSSLQEMVENINVWFKEAKQMEKEQIKDAYYYDPNTDDVKDCGEQYYNETFGNK